MKVVINKTGRNYIDYSNIIKSFEEHNFAYRDCEVEDYRSKNRCIEYYCTNCGCELQGVWNKQWLHRKHSFPCSLRCRSEHECQKIDDIIEPINQELRNLEQGVYRKEQDELARLTHCPVCGAELKRERGYFFANVFSLHKDDENFPDDLKHERDYDKYHHPNIIEQEKNKIVKMAEEFAVSCDVSVAENLSTTNLANIVSTPSNLKEYLQHLIELEMNIYSLTKRLEKLYAQRVLSNRNLILSQHFPEYEKRNEIEIAELELRKCQQKEEQYNQGEIGISFPLKPNVPTFATPNFFNKKKVIAENEALQLKYQNELQSYEKAVNQYEAKKRRLISIAKDEVQKAEHTVKTLKVELMQISKSNNLVISATFSKDVVDKEIKDAENLLKELYECRNRLYSYNIVFGKYRNVVALSTFCEYLMAGRCKTLEGADGAYNLYENQIRADMIIGQLSQVIEKLDEIKDTQYMIYSELQNVNKNLDHLNKTMDKALVSIQNMEKDIAHISANTDVIAHNTAVTAYYSKMNAELTNSLGYMMAFK